MLCEVLSSPFLLAMCGRWEDKWGKGWVFEMEIGEIEMKGWDFLEEEYYRGGCDMVVVEEEGDCGRRKRESKHFFF